MDDSAAKRAAVAERAARSGGAVAAEAFRSTLSVEQKSGELDVVTQADRDAQRRVVEVIRESYPDDVVIGEEEDEHADVPEEGAAWIVDPIDGTSNYVNEFQLWGTSVAAVVDAQPVASANVMPALDDAYVAADGVTRNGDPISVSERTDPETFTVSPTFWWGFERRDQFTAAAREIVERFGDLRRYGSAQLTLSLVAAGGLDATISNVTPNPWDSVAGVHMIRKAGGIVTDLSGDPWRYDSEGIVASNGEAHEEVLAAARAIDR